MHTVRPNLYVPVHTQPAVLPSMRCVMTPAALKKCGKSGLPHVHCVAMTHLPVRGSAVVHCNQLLQDILRNVLSEHQLFTLLRLVFQEGKPVLLAGMSGMPKQTVYVNAPPTQQMVAQSNY